MEFSCTKEDELHVAYADFKAINLAEDCISLHHEASSINPACESACYEELQSRGGSVGVSNRVFSRVISGEAGLAPVAGTVEHLTSVMKKTIPLQTFAAAPRPL